jgi:CRISPR system Cascade subunit CasC
MSLFLEFHLIQNFAPSNLNRRRHRRAQGRLFGGQRRPASAANASSARCG